MRTIETHLGSEPEPIRASHLNEPPAVNPDTSATAVTCRSRSSSRHVNHVVIFFSIEERRCNPRSGSNPLGKVFAASQNDIFCSCRCMEATEKAEL